MVPYGSLTSCFSVKQLIPFLDVFIFVVEEFWEEGAMGLRRSNATSKSAMILMELPIFDNLTGEFQLVPQLFPTSNWTHFMPNCFLCKTRTSTLPTSQRLARS